MSPKNKYKFGEIFKYFIITDGTELNPIVSLTTSVVKKQPKSLILLVHGVRISKNSQRY